MPTSAYNHTIKNKPLLGTYKILYYCKHFVPEIHYIIVFIMKINLYSGTLYIIHHHCEKQKTLLIQIDIWILIK